MMENDLQCLDQELGLSIIVCDVCDGAMRLLGDVQRFGFKLQHFYIDTTPEGFASIQAMLSIPWSADSPQVCSRLERHVAVVSVEMIPLPSQPRMICADTRTPQLTAHP